MRNDLARIGLAFLCAACASNLASPSQVGSTPCQSDVGCPGEQVCLGNSCVELDTTNIAAEVIPPHDSDLQPEDFANILDGGSISLRLDPPGGFAFQTTYLGVTPEVGKEIDISVYGFSLAVPDHQVGAKATLTATGQQVQTQTGVYSIVALPQDGITPPIQQNDALTLSTAGSFEAIPIDFATPDAGGWATIHGSIAINPLLPAQSIVADGGAVAFMVQAFTAPPMSSQSDAISQPVYVGTDGGSTFTLELSAQPLGTQVSLNVTPISGLAPSGVFLTTLDSSVQSVTLELGEGLDLLPLDGQVVSGDGGLPVAGALVTLTGALASNQGSVTFVSPTVITSATGNFSTLVAHDVLHHDTYSALVVPQDPQLATFQSPPVTYGGSPMPPSTLGMPAIAVPSAVTVSGRVLDHSGNPVAGASINCIPDAYLNQGSVPLTQTSAISGGDGGFSFPVTPGYYDFDFSAPSSMLVPSSSRGPLPIGIASLDGGAASNAQTLPDFTLSLGRTVTGTLQDSTGAAVTNATLIRILVVPPATSPGAVVRSTLVSEAQVQPGGTFTILLPTRSE